MLKRPRTRPWRLVWYELALGLRGAPGLASLVLCCAAGLAAGSSDGMTPSLAGYRVARLGALLLGFLCLPLMAGAARRDAAARTTEMIQSRPHLAHELLLLRWLGNLALMLVLLLVLCVFTFGAQGLLAKPPPGDAGPRWSLLAMWHALMLAALPLVFLSALAYCAVEVLQNVLATAVIAVYWLFIMLGRDYLARIFDFTLSQNAGVYLLLAGGFLAAAMAVARHRQGVKTGPGLELPLLSLALSGAGVLLAWRLVMTRHDPPLHADPVTVTVASQTIRSGRLPGFWLPDQHGRPVRLRDFAGQPLVVGFFSPAVPASLSLLGDLENIHRNWHARGVRIVAVCLADDVHTGARIGRERRCPFPVVTDEGTHWAERIVDSSPLAEAYGVESLPAVFVADGERNQVIGQATPGSGTTGLIEAALRTVLP